MTIVDNPRPQWSIYDITDNPEHDLFESSIVEFCDIFGIEVYYYVINPEWDVIYGEDPNLKYLEPILMKCIYKPGEEPVMFGPWGVQGDELIEQLCIPKFTWTRDVTAADHPVIGDAIRVPWNISGKIGNTMIYEVTDVGEESNIFQLKKFNWELILKPFRGSEDDNAVDLSGELDSVPISAFGDNVEIQQESDLIDDYADLPNIEDIYGYK